LLTEANVQIKRLGNEVEIGNREFDKLENEFKKQSAIWNQQFGNQNLLKEQKRQIDIGNANLIKSNNKIENLKRELETNNLKHKKLNVKEASGQQNWVFHKSKEQEKTFDLKIQKLNQVVEHYEIILFDGV